MDGAVGSHDEFVDVPDEISDVSVLSRSDDTVTLQWCAPDDNGLPIDRYQVLLKLWRMGEHGEHLQVPNDAIVSMDDSVIVTVLAEDLVFVAERCSVEISVQTLSFPEGLPRAVWAVASARNAEGWADWSAPQFVLLRPCSRRGVLHMWGLAEDGRLGRGPSALERGVCADAESIEMLRDKEITAIALGSHTAVITSDDSLFVWGTYLAEENVPVETDPEVEMLVEPAQQPFQSVPHHVSCGRFTTAVLSADGHLFMWGPNEAHQCGVTEPDVVRSVRRVGIPGDLPLIDVELGEFHGVALTAQGTAVVWGMEQGPQVEVGTQKVPGVRLPERAAFNQPQPRTLDLPQSVVAIAVGGYHSAIITESGSLWTWGQNDHCQLGLGTGVPLVWSPRMVPCERMVKVSLGGFHSAAVDESGRAFTWGDNKRGQCGQGEQSMIPNPSLLNWPGDPRCLEVSCGGFFSFFKVEEPCTDARFYACGWGKDGCLGFGQACKRMLKPRPLPAIRGKTWTHIEAGMVHVGGLLATP